MLTLVPVHCKHGVILDVLSGALVPAAMQMWTLLAVLATLCSANVCTRQQSQPASSESILGCSCFVSTVTCCVAKLSREWQLTWHV